MSKPGGLFNRVDRLRVGTPAAVADGDLSVSGNLSVGGTQTFTGNTTVSGTLSVTSTLTVTGASALNGGATVASLLITGAPTPTAGDVGVTNEVDARANATGRGTIAFPGTTNISNATMFKVYSGLTPYWIPAFSALYSI